MGETKRAAVRLFLVSVFALLWVAGCASVENVRFRAGGAEHAALLCRPKKGSPPFAAVIFHHGMVVDLHGLSGAFERGYSLDSFCHALAEDGFLAFLPVRGGLQSLARQGAIVRDAFDHVWRLKEADPARVAVAGFSRGALLTLLAAEGSLPAKAFVLLAPAPGPGGELEAASHDVSGIRAPLQLLMARGDDAAILEGSERLRAALERGGKAVDYRLYAEGPSDCRPGPGPPCGHRLFYSVGAYWADVRDFLQKALR
ncbi:MAG: dienelactone hydrolase family protein [Candidatus Tectomicrobia bacterium]|nr:dienelactone hydrolase family protein [Candidatus Tectomicrobia bacterium]